jgi:trehalose 6-phosphate phosphatase
VTRYLFSKIGLNDLLKFISPQTLLAFDFDGTLTGLTPDYSQIRLKASLQKKIELLSSRALIAIISGRSRKFLIENTLSLDAIYIGNHGLEGVNRLTLKQKNLYMRQVQKIIKATSHIAGLEVEDKKISLSLHFSNSQKPLKTRQALVDAIKNLRPQPRLISGKGLLNCLTTHEINKGKAVLDILKKHKCLNAIYVGDDGTDEDVFSLKSKRIFSIKVGNSKKTKAKYYLRNQGEVEVLISLILKLLKPGHLNSF